MKITLNINNVSYSAAGAILSKSGEMLGTIDKSVVFPSKNEALDFAKAQAKTLGGKAVASIVTNRGEDRILVGETDMTPDEVGKLLGITFKEKQKFTKRNSDEIRNDIANELRNKNIGRSVNGNYMLIHDSKSGKDNRTLNSAEVKALEELGGLENPNFAVQFDHNSEYPANM